MQSSLAKNRIANNITGIKPAVQLPQGIYAPIKSRRISEQTCRLYDYKASSDFFYRGERQQAHFAFVRDQENNVVGAHIRIVNGKNWIWKGQSRDTQLFGQHTANKGDVLIITEGEIDAMSVYQCLTPQQRRTMAVVSVTSGSNSAVKQIEANYTYVRQFGLIVIFFDQDEPGKKAAKEVLDKLQVSVAVVTAFPYKDANEAYLKRDEESIMRAINQCKPSLPEELVAAVDLEKRVLQRDRSKGFLFPWPGWNKATLGMKPGEVHMLAAGTGTGKSMFARSIALNLCLCGVRVAFMNLEEEPETTYERMISEAMGQTYYLWDNERRNKPENIEVMRRTVKTFAHNLFLLDKFGMSDLRSFINLVVHYVKNEQCEVVVLDHFSLLADAIDLRADQRRTIDKAIAELKTIAMRERFCFLIVSHLSRDTGSHKSFEEGAEPQISNLRGSASLGQIPNYIWMLQRDPYNPQGNETKCHLKKNRETGVVGWRSTIEFNPKNYRLREIDSPS